MDEIVQKLEPPITIHQAAEDGEIEAIKWHIDLIGTDVNAKTVNDATPLHLTWDTEVTKLLINAGAEVNAKTTDGDTPLHTALSENKLEIAELLITNGADVNVKSGGSIRGGGRAFSGCGSRFAHDGSPGAFVIAAALVWCGLLKSAFVRSIAALCWVWDASRPDSFFGYSSSSVW